VRPGGPAAGDRDLPEETRLTRISKDCFGTVIASLTKMKECVRCEFQRECQAINWAAAEMDAPPVVVRRPIEAAAKGEGSRG
jgi:hypothetical protein